MATGDEDDRTIGLRLRHNLRRGYGCQEGYGGRR